MTIIEVFATIFAVFALIKIIVILINPRSWISVPKTLFKCSILLTLIYLILAGVVGYYILQSLSIVEIAAVMLFTGLLIALSALAFSETIMKVAQEVLTKEVIRKSWLSILIWAAIAIWTLYAVFAT